MHHNRAQCRAARLAELERRVRVARHEHLLHRHFVGPVFGDDRGQTIEQALEPLRESALARSEEHTSELQSLMRISYAVFCLKKKKIHTTLNQMSSTEKHTREASKDTITTL